MKFQCAFIRFRLRLRHLGQPTVLFVFSRRCRYPAMCQPGRLQDPARNVRRPGRVHPRLRLATPPTAHGKYRTPWLISDTVRNRIDMANIIIKLPNHTGYPNYPYAV